MNQQFEYLFARRIPINYDSPAACEVNFSSTAEPMIVLDPFPVRRGPTGIRFEFDGQWKLKWDAYPGALCYSVYKAVDESDPYGDYVLIAECIPGTEIVIDPPGAGGQSTYRVTVITEDGETPIEDSPPTTLLGLCPEVTGQSPAPEPAFHEYQGYDDVSLSVSVIGTPPFDFKWYHDWVWHHDSTTASFDFPMRKNMAGHWHVTVEGHVSGCGMVGSQLWDIRYLPLEIITTGTLDPAACVNQAYAYPCEAMHGTPLPPPSTDPYLWDITMGTLPTGLTINHFTGVIAGTPTGTGSSNFQLTVQDAEGDTSSSLCTIVVAGFSTPPGPTLPYGRTGDAYGPVTVLFGPAATCALTGGALPPGLTISPAGTITGTPTTGGTYSFTLTVASTGMPAYSCSQTYSIKIWTACNVNVCDLHLTTGATVPALGTYGPGLYRLEGYNGGTPEGYGWIWEPPPNDYYVGVSGAIGAGPAPVFTCDGTNYNIGGAGVRRSTSAQALIDACANLFGIVVLEFVCDGAGVMSAYWAPKPAQYFEHVEAWSFGGSGCYYHVNRVGT